jgi:glycosyltransferase involved in cell wall biosynthesis
MALYGDVTFDSRVQREADVLSQAGHHVTVFCLAGSAQNSSFQVVARRPDRSAVLPDGSSPFLRGGRSTSVAGLVARVRWMIGYVRNIRAWGNWAIAAGGDVDVWHAHDLTGLLAVAPLVRRPARLVYDSHEIFLETGTAARLPKPLRRLLGAYEKRLTGRADALVTVNDSYADVLNRRLRPRRLLIVRNCPPRWDPPPGSGARLRAAASIPEGRPVVLYHGGLTSHRGIEQLMEAMLEPGLEAAHLVLMGFGEDRQRLAVDVQDPKLEGRVHLLDAVPPGELLEWVAGADVNAIPLQRSTLNHWLCTPNKLWESLAAGVPVVVSNFPTMREIVTTDAAGPLGGVCDPSDPASIAGSIVAILELSAGERAALRERCLRVAHERWNWEQESSRLVGLYADIEATA